MHFHISQRGKPVIKNKGQRKKLFNDDFRETDLRRTFRNLYPHHHNHTAVWDAQDHTNSSKAETMVPVKDRIYQWAVEQCYNYFWA